MNFLLIKYVRLKSGAWGSGDVRNLEKDFGFCRYKSLSGLNAVGSPKGVYTEDYVDGSSLRVWLPDTMKLSATDVTLSVLFFGSDPSLPVTLSTEELISKAEESWTAFREWLSGGVFVWYDDVRQRRALLCPTEACEPSVDVVKGVPYIQCDVKFKNLFGRSFSGSDTTIAEWLKNGGKDIV